MYSPIIVIGWGVLMIVLGAANVGFGIARWRALHPKPITGIPHNSYFHAPPSGCPTGTTLAPGFFKRDGKTVDACFNPNGDGTIDVLYPGESFTLEVPFRAEGR